MALPPHRVDYSPIIDRPKITWPNNARVAFWVAPNVEHYEYLPDFEDSGTPGRACRIPMCESTATATTGIELASGA